MTQGDFVWHELCTPNPAEAATFYAKILGFTLTQSPVPGIDYIILNAGPHRIGGIVSLPPEQMPPRPVWFGYIGVADVDAKAEEVKAAGGAIHKPPTDIPGIGRFAVAVDPQGAAFLLFKGAGAPPPPTQFMHPGSIAWNELHTNNVDAAWQFYETLFGWQKDAVHDMGPMGAYQLFKTGAMPCGGFLQDTQTSPIPYWLYYFAVPDIGAAVARIAENGGTLLSGPHPIPGGIWSLHAQDPQNGIFALVGPKTS